MSEHLQYLPLPLEAGTNDGDVLASYQGAEAFKRIMFRVAAGTVRVEAFIDAGATPNWEPVSIFAASQEDAPTYAATWDNADGLGCCKARVRGFRIVQSGATAASLSGAVLFND